MSEYENWESNMLGVQPLKARTLRGVFMRYWFASRSSYRLVFLVGSESAMHMASNVPGFQRTGEPFAGRTVSSCNLTGNLFDILDSRHP